MLEDLTSQEIPPTIMARVELVRNSDKLFPKLRAIFPAVLPVLPVVAPCDNGGVDKTQTPFR